MVDATSELAVEVCIAVALVAVSAVKVELLCDVILAVSVVLDVKMSTVVLKRAGIVEVISVEELELGIEVDGDKVLVDSILVVV